MQGDKGLELPSPCLAGITRLHIRPFETSASEWDVSLPLVIRVVTLADMVPTTLSASDCSLFSQYKHGGPIIAVQVENEYGSYNKDPAYMPYIKKVRVSSAHPAHSAYGL